MKDWDESYWEKQFRKCRTDDCIEKAMAKRNRAYKRYEDKRRAHFEKYSWMYSVNMGSKPTYPPYRVLWDAKYENYSARTGKPYCSYLSKTLGFRVTGKMRDAIWADYYNHYERRDNPKLKVSMTWSDIEKKVGFDYNKWRSKYTGINI